MSGLAGRDDRPTLIVISHDRSVVEFAAQVYRLENGSLHAGPQALVNAAAI
jgi:ABC-type lipoprotein export system ATPase subunit